MRKIFGLLVMLFLATVVMYACGGGGGSGPSVAFAVPPTILNEGVVKNIEVSYGGGMSFGSFNNVTSAVTVTGTMVSFLDNSGTQQVFINAPIRITER